MLAGDNKNSVLSESGAGDRREIAYSPYGHSEGAKGSLGYNGELREAPTGWYLLGNGYRAFNPLLMRFHGPDSWSPFGKGGLNAYTYCLGDPIKWKDETGHMVNPAKAVKAVSFIKQAKAEVAAEFAGRSLRGAVNTKAISTTVAETSTVSGARGMSTQVDIPVVNTRPISERPPMPLPKPVPKSYLNSSNPVAQWAEESNPVFSIEEGAGFALDEVAGPSQPVSVSKAVKKTPNAQLSVRSSKQPPAPQSKLTEAQRRKLQTEKINKIREKDKADGNHYR